MSGPLLQISDLHLGFKTGGKLSEVLHGISLHINSGERVALVGESGSGKSVTARIILGLIQSLPNSHVSGRVAFSGQDMETMNVRVRNGLRGTRISMIFQDPTSSLNPVFPIGVQFHEVLRRVEPKVSIEDARIRMTAALDEVAIEDPERVLDSYPFQLSGGMNQRVMIAMALANTPELLIADEPGTALDVTVQAQTLHLMSRLVKRTGTSVLLISHNLGVVREFADRVYVIYNGRIVEQARTSELFANPRHPYTKALLAAVPRITGGGIPDIAEQSGQFLAPLVVHEGCEEPGSVQ